MQTLQAGPPTGNRRTGNGMEDLRSYAHVRRLCKYIYFCFGGSANESPHYLDRQILVLTFLPQFSNAWAFTNPLERFRQNPNQTEY